MHENEFNNAVAQLLKVNLERCGFRTLMAAPTDADTPLKTRTDTANNAKADFYISIHANALNGQWGEQNGVSTYFYPGSEKGYTAAVIIHRHLTKGTPQKDRGVKSENFHILREAKMPSVLVECAFMDNLKEAQLLLTDAYRRECADEICQGICEYFGVAYVQSVAIGMTVQDAVEFLHNTNPVIVNDIPLGLKNAMVNKYIYDLMNNVVNYIKKGGKAK
jgi:N-acetylmuramoyl-L-alanine amidase